MYSNNKSFLEKMVTNFESQPSHAEIYAVRQYSIQELHNKVKKILRYTSDACNISADRYDMLVQKDRTLLRLPKEGRAIIHHASGAVKITSGLKPMELMFEKQESKENYVKLSQSVFSKLNLEELAGRNESIRFEKLWQIKAAATDRQNNFVEARLCRVVGAFRHYAGNLPVLGPASVAIKIASGGTVDSIQMLIREPEGKPIEWAPVISSEEAAHKVYTQLSSLMGRTKIPVHELITNQSMQFGYITLGKRKAQRVLAPYYIAAVSIRGEQEAQAYQFLVPATEKIYLPVCYAGGNPPVNTTQKTSATNKCL